MHVSELARSRWRHNYSYYCVACHSWSATNLMRKVWIIELERTTDAECFFLWSSSVGGGFLSKAKIIFGSVWFSFGSVWFYLLCSYKKCINTFWFSNYRSVVQCFLTRESKCSVLQFWNRTPVKENCILMTWNQLFMRMQFSLPVNQNVVF